MINILPFDLERVKYLDCRDSGDTAFDNDTGILL